MTTRLQDVIVPEIFNPYVLQRTAEKSRLIQSGAMVLDPSLVSALQGGGLTFNSPSFQDLENEDENISNDNPESKSEPGKIETSLETQVRLSRNHSWGSMNLAAALAGADPMSAIGENVAGYWARRLQAAFIATMTGVFNNNDKETPGGTSESEDLLFDASGSEFADGVTNFNGKNFVDATVTMGDSMEELGLVMVHSTVYAGMQKNNMIIYVEESDSKVKIPTFHGRRVVVDDAMPNDDGVFESWLFGGGAVRFGQNAPENASETKRNPDAGNGAGEDLLFSRTQWIIHPVGYRYAVGSPAAGGPSNAATSGNLAHEDSFLRAFPERKQIKIARLITREYAAAPQ